VSALLPEDACVIDVDEAMYHLHVKRYLDDDSQVVVTALIGAEHDHDDEVETSVSVVVERAALLRALLPEQVRDYLVALLDVDACARDEDEMVGAYTPATRAAAWDLLTIAGAS
jgi:hypothetical protein